MLRYYYNALCYNDVFVMLQSSKGRRFESCASSIFRNAYFLQPLFGRFYVVAVMVTLKPDSTLYVEIFNFLLKYLIVTLHSWPFTFTTH